MRKITLAFTILIGVHASLFAQSNTYVINNVTVIPMTHEAALPGQTVVIQDGVISQIGASQKVKKPGNAVVIDGTGKYLMPGLFDMHTHFFHEQGEYKNTCEKELKLMLANGLSTVRIMSGHPAYLDAREKVRTKQWIGPNMSVVSPQFVGRWPWPADFKNFEIVDTKAKALEAVKKYKQEGYDEIKITFMITRNAYDGIIEAAKQEKIKVTGHVGPQVKLPAALAARQQIEHMDEFIDMLLPDTSYNHGQSVSDMNIWRPKAWATVPYLDERKIPSLVQQVKQAGIFVTPTNYFFFSSFGSGMSNEEYAQKPDYEFIPSVIKKERWEIKNRYWRKAPPDSSRKMFVYIKKKLTRELWKAGVPLMAGSDSPEWFLVQGCSIHDELRTFVECGLTNFAALQTATVNPATYMGVIKNKGTVEVGKDADLLLLDRNPLENINHTREINSVFIGTDFYNRKAIDKFLEEARSLSKE